MRRSCWVGKAARNMPPLISTIVMSRLFARRRFGQCRIFNQPLTAHTGPGLLMTQGTAAGFLSGRAARGSVAPRKMACHQPRLGKSRSWSKAIDSRERGSLFAAPFEWGAEMDAKALDLLYSRRCQCSAQCLLGQGRP
jgi:hypothetical protein